MLLLTTVSRIWSDHPETLLSDDTPLRAAESALDGYLESRSRQVAEDGLRGAEREVWLARRLLSYDLEGGFSVWAYDGCSDDSWETGEALRSMGAVKAARMVRRAVRLVDWVEAKEDRYEGWLDSPYRARRDLARRKIDALTTYETTQFTKLDAAFLSEPHYLTVRVGILRYALRTIGCGADQHG
jgi:hypothetical protein